MPRPLYPRERPGIHCTEGWVGPRVGLNVCEKSRPHRDFCFCFNIHFIPQRQQHIQAQHRDIRDTVQVLTRHHQEKHLEIKYPCISGRLYRVVPLQCPPLTPEERILSTMYQNQNRRHKTQRRWPVSVSLGPPERMQLLVYHPPSVVGR
jgi:hypothetical protein